MSDLISRSELLEELKSLKIVLNGKEIFSDDVKDEVLRIVNEQPTAYDIDKVVEELEKNADESHKEYCVRAQYEAYATAIEIVKQGGITYDCNNCANYTEPDEIDNGCYLCCKGYENNYKPKADNGGVPDDVCEWKPDKDFDGMYKACSGDVTYLKGFKYCPYCGKKIKIKESD